MSIDTGERSSSTLDLCDDIHSFVPFSIYSVQCTKQVKMSMGCHSRGQMKNYCDVLLGYWKIRANVPCFRGRHLLKMVLSSSKDKCKMFGVCQSTTVSFLFSFVASLACALCVQYHSDALSINVATDWKQQLMFRCAQCCSQQCWSHNSAMTGISLDKKYCSNKTSSKAWCNSRVHLAWSL